MLRSCSVGILFRVCSTIELSEMPLSFTASAEYNTKNNSFKLSESNLVDLIDNILNEAVEVKKQEWVNEQADNRKLMESKISKLEKALQRITEGK
jgi:UDP-glucose 6-dehydrogenase